MLSLFFSQNQSVKHYKKRKFNSDEEQLQNRHWYLFGFVAILNSINATTTVYTHRISDRMRSKK